MNEENHNSGINCPTPINDYDKILLAHGSGGTLSHNLISRMIQPGFSNEYLDKLHDSAVFEINNQRIAFTTDSYVVKPLFFPGGDIGKLAVYGTVNDLVCAGAKPLFISVSFIIEEGLPINDFQKIILSIRSAAEYSGVKIVTGDTKVVEKGKGDLIFINTSGIGTVRDGVDISPGNVRPGDNIILNGSIAEHGIAIMAARETLEFETNIQSDAAPLNGLMEEILNATNNIHMMRDPTRGGISSALNEIAKSSKTGLMIEESKIQIKEEVKGACELLGFDPLSVANEGKLLIFVPESATEKVLGVMRNHPLGKNARVIGKVTDSVNPGSVVMKTCIGTYRIVDMLTGDQLPRIC